MNEVEPHHWHRITVRRMTHCDAEVMVLVPDSLGNAPSIAHIAAAVADGTGKWGPDTIEYRSIALNRATEVTQVPTMSVP